MLLIQYLITHLPSDQITKLDVSIRQTIHSDARATANLTVSSADDQQYLGPLNLTLLYNGSFQAGTYNLGSSGGVQQLNVGTGNPGVVDIVFRAGNDISGVQKGVSSLVVVGECCVDPSMSWKVHVTGDCFHRPGSVWFTPAWLQGRIPP